ncbi:hypothetical protein GPECTOR_16g700 [Gonium pectorale]|uniref:Protein DETOXIFICATION n=1 Tax=Gonium pectorale TaxID=33097 RepID=A0A150GLB1_GONPE|nr:hypothetical protein GPECTOR_16g700 [Gonium pectorale]|eukprot:KXZ50525.1 hypothetical protein GPECTOR_16g700 [Gonium pectorale]
MLLEPVMNALNAGLVGHLGTQQLSAVSLGSLAVSFVTFLFSFLVFLTVPEIAAAVVKNDSEEVSCIAAKSLWIAVVCGFSSAAVLYGSAGWIVGALNPPEAAVAAYATDYIRVRSLGIPAALLGFVATGVFRGFKDTRTPLVGAVASAAVSLGLNILLLYGGCCCTIWILTIQFFECLNVAAQALCATYLGKEDVATARSLLDRLAVLGCGIGLLAGCAVWGAQGPLVGFFTRDPLVVAQAIATLPLICALFPVDAAAAIMDGSLLAAKQSNYMSVVQIVGSVVQYGVLAYLAATGNAATLSVWGALKILSVARLIGGAARNYASPKSAYLVPPAAPAPAPAIAGREAQPPAASLAAPEAVSSTAAVSEPAPAAAAAPSTSGREEAPDHARRGGKVITPPQTAIYDPKILDQINVSLLLKQLPGAGTLDVSRLLLPLYPAPAGPGTAGTNGRVASAAGDNPFAAPGPAPAAGPLTASLARSFGGVGAPAAGDNAFGGPPAPSSASVGGSGRHSHHVSADNPFGASEGGGPGGGANPFAAGNGKPPAGPSAGGAALGDAGMFKKTKSKASGAGTSGGASEPPITSLNPGVKLSYSAGAGGSSTSPQRPQQQQQADGARGRAEAQRGPGGGAAEADAYGTTRLARLDLPQLETGQTEEQLRDLAYLLFAACASGSGLPQHASLLPVMRQQLCIDEARAADVGRVLRHIQPGGQPTLLDALHPQQPPDDGPWRPSQRASLQLLLRLIAVVRPGDFEAATPEKAFRGFLRWKDVTVAVLERQLAVAVASGWTGDKAQLKKMLARMHGAARRADVRGEGDFEEEEYGEATCCLAAVAGQLAAGCATGLRFPWAVRVRLAEILVTALFDTVEEGSYIDEAALVLQFLDSTMWPALGLAAPAALAVSAWVHFSMYLATGCRDARLLRLLKNQISKLAQAAAEANAAKGGGDLVGLAPEPGSGAAPPPDELARDAALASQVAHHIVDFVHTRLRDFHAAFPRGENLAALLDVFVFGCRSRGDSPARLAELLVGAVRDSTAAQFGRLLAAADPGASVSGITPGVLDVFRTANALEQRLAAALRKAPAGPSPADPVPPVASPGASAGGGAAAYPAVAEALGTFSRWDLAAPLKSAMLQWVSSQVANMNTWAARALQTEKWKPLGSTPEASHCQSAADVSRMTLEALDALYGMDVPLPREVPAALLEGIDGVLRRYVTFVNDKLGPLQRLMPPLPPTTRYKKDVVVKQETAELEAAKGGTLRGAKKANVFLASVPPVESSPDHTNISSSLPPEVLAAAACSLHYLAVRAEGLLQAEPSGGGGLPDEPLAAARTALSTGMQYACKFLATRVVFWDQRFAWLEQLYRHHASAPASRMEPLIEGLNRALGGLCPGMPDPVRGAFARHLLGAAVQAMERVLLDGGPCRWFIPSDVNIIDQDLHKLRSLFHAEGEGLDREMIDGELERLRRLLPLMRTEVGPLMDLLKTARTHGTAQLTPSGGGPGAAFDESTIMRVIAHRPERNGSKLLKTLYKLSKRIK